MFTGILSGLAAILLKNIVYYAHYFITGGFSYERLNFLYMAFPLLGILLTIIFVRYVIRDDISHGISRILHSISRGKGVLKRHNTYSSMVGSTLTIAFGGSVGLEAPILLTGSAIGSRLGTIFRLNYRVMVLLIGCGTAGALAGIFKSPIAAVVFVIEVLMLDLTVTNVIPLLIAAVSGAVVAFFLLGKSVLFSFEIIDPFMLRDIPWFILLGAFTGLVSIYFTRITLFIEGRFRLFRNWLRKALAGGIVLGLLIFVFPSLYGEGYEALRFILHGNTGNLVDGSLLPYLPDKVFLLLLVLLFTLVFKAVAMAVTTGSGGIGGVFAPALFMGGISGIFLAKAINLTGIIQVPETNFALVGMAGVMAGAMHAPLTAIFLIAEITGGYMLLTPLIITSTIAYITSRYFISYSLYTDTLARKGELITHHKDKATLSLMKVSNLIETNFNPVSIHATLGDFTKAVETSSRNIFPVLDEENHFHGMIFINDIRKIVFKTELYDTTYVKDLMYMPGVTIHPEESMEEVINKFNITGDYNIPVIRDGKYLGFVSRANILTAYRKLLKEMSDDIY
jgi:CIC family chloride channel protein